MEKENMISRIRFLIPNLFTGLSLFAALIALQKIFESDFIFASWLIAVSMICDGLDGKLARYLNAQTKFGAQFDTLSDFVAFGVVPAFLAYKAALHQLGLLGSIAPIFYVFCSGYRLVRFTLRNTVSTVKQPFTGLPIPAAACLIAAYLLVNLYLWNSVRSLHLFLGITFIASLLMISRIKYLPIEKNKKLSKEAKFFITLFLISIFVAIKFAYYVFGGWVILYIMYGLVRHLIIHLKK